MAEFNPDSGNFQAQDQTGVSRGTGPNQAFETLFSGLGDALESGVQTSDNYIQNTIEDDAREGFDALNQGFGMTPETVPADLTRSGDSLSKLASAYNQGKVTQEYYYQRLASNLKSLRSKYPGYEKQVDDIVQRVTGTRPANAFRDAMMANMEAANASASSASDKYQQWVVQDGNIGYIQMAFPDYFENPGKYSPEQVYSGVAALKGADQTWESQKLQLEGNKAFAGQALNERLSYVGSSLLQGAGNSMGVGGSDFMQKLDTFQRKGGGSPEEVAALKNGYEQFVFAAQSAMIKETSDPVFIKQFTPTELDQYRQSAMKPLLQIRDLLAQDQYSEAAMIMARNQNLQNKALSSLYKNDPNLLASSALSKISPELADFFTQDLMTREGGPAGYAEKVAITDQMISIVGGDDTLSQATRRIIENKNATQSQKNAQAGTLVDQFTTTLKSGKADAETVSRVVQQNYAEGIDDIFGMVDTSTDAKGNSQYLRLYGQMFNPEITKNIINSNDPAALKAYTDAAVDKFQAIPEFRKAAADLTDTAAYSKYFRARYDEGSNRIILEADQGAINNLGYFNKSDEKLHLQQAIKAKDAFNQALSVMAPIIEASGGNELEGIQKLMGSVALNLQPDKKKGFFGWLNDSLDSAVQDLMTPVGKVGKEKEGGKEPASSFQEVGSGATEEINDELSFDIPLTDDFVGASANAGSIQEGLTARGLPDHVARGIIANLRDESNLNPAISEQNPLVRGSRGGYGLAQWTGPRRRQLEAYAEDRGVSPADADVQLDFLMEELNTTESAAYRRLLRTDNAAEAAQVFLNHFERPAERHRRTRELAYANID